MGQELEKTKGTPPAGSIPINGKGQIIEMLQMMPSHERSTLLKNIKIRNPAMAQELSEQSFSFNSLESFEDHQLTLILNYLNPQVVGVALKNSSVGFQRRLLTLCQRSFAEKAYTTLISPVVDEAQNIKRAQTRFLQAALDLYRRGILKLV